MASDIYQQSPPNGYANYSFPGVLHYLQMEWRKFEKEKTEWEIEKTDLKSRLSFLEGERRGIENLKVDLLRRIKMLEYALRQERIKYLQLQQKINNNEVNISASTDKISTNINDSEVIPREANSNGEKQEKVETTEAVASNTNLNKLGNKDQSLLKSQISIKNEEGNTLTPTPMSGNNLLLYSKGCGTLRSREILKAYLLEIGYWNPSSNNTNSINDIRNFKHNNESSSTVNTLPNNNSLQKSIKTATYTPINKEKSLKPINPSSPNINNNTGAGGISNSNNNSINGNSSEYSMFMKKKMTGKRKEAPLSKLLFKASDENEKEELTSNESTEANKEVNKNNNQSSTEANVDENKNNTSNNNNNNKEEELLFQSEGVIPTKQLNKVLKASKLKDKKRSIKGAKKDSFTFGNEIYNFDGEEMGESLSKSASKQNDENKLWRPKLTLKNHLDTVRSLSFHHTDKILLSGSDDGTAKLWNLEFLGNTKKSMIDIDPVYTYRGHMGPVLSVDILDDVCYTGGLDSTVRSWKVPPKNLELYSKYDPSIKQHTFEGHTDAVWCVKAHPLKDQYHLLASASSDGTVKLWDTESYDLKSTLDYNGLVSESKEVEANPTYMDWLQTDYSKIIVSYQNSIVKLFDLETGSEFMKLPSAETYDNTPGTQINQVISHPTMPLIITAHEDRYIRFFDIKSGECINSMTAHLDGVTSLSIHPSGISFASGGHDSSIRIWDISSKNCIQEMSSHRKKFDEGVWCVKYHPTLSTILASCGGDSTCKIYSIDQPF